MPIRDKIGINGGKHSVDQTNQGNDNPLSGIIGCYRLFNAMNYDYYTTPSDVTNTPCNSVPTHNTYGVVGGANQRDRINNLKNNGGFDVLITQSVFVVGEGFPNRMWSAQELGCDPFDYQTAVNNSKAYWDSWFGTYCGNMDEVSIGNEFWGDITADGLRAWIEGALVSKAENCPNIKMCLSSFRYDDSYFGSGHDLITELYPTANDIPQGIDCLDIHPYAFDQPGQANAQSLNACPFKSGSDSNSNLDALDRYNTNNLPYTVSEFGYDSQTVGERLQAAWTLQFLVSQLANPNFDKMFAYQDRDNVQSSSQFYDNLYNSSGWFYQSTTGGFGQAKQIVDVFEEFLNTVGDYDFNRVVEDNNDVFIISVVDQNGNECLIAFTKGSCGTPNQTNSRFLELSDYGYNQTPSNVVSLEQRNCCWLQNEQRIVLQDMPTIICL